MFHLELVASLTSQFGRVILSHTSKADLTEGQEQDGLNDEIRGLLLCVSRLSHQTFLCACVLEPPAEGLTVPHSIPLARISHLRNTF